jgi:hypothetical protein
MKIMANHTSATEREETPHVLATSRTNTIINALKRRAQAVLNDTSIDAGSRAIIRYSLEINDPWLARLVKRVDEGERISETFDFSQPAATNEESSSEEKTDAAAKEGGAEKIDGLTEIICRAGSDSAAALLVLMATLENSPHPRLLANAAKHFAFTRCGDLNLYRTVSAFIEQIEDERCVC